MTISERFARNPEPEPEVRVLETLEFRIHGRAAPQGSKGHVGRGRMIESSKYLKAWRRTAESAAWAAATQARWRLQGGPIALWLWIYRPPVKAPRWKALGLPDTAPDWDKLARAIGDALEGVIYKNDGQITDGHVFKRFSEQPGAFVRVERLVEMAATRKAKK